jgi:beta-N-acetylhexosaminidase
LIVVLNALYLSYAHFIGPQGWAFVIGGPATTGNDNPLAIINKELHHGLTPGATAQATPQMTPQQYINLIVQHMTLDEKLGQMIIVQFVGPTYSLDISTMISQYHVGAALLFTANDNIYNKAQLKGLIQQMQSNTAIPMIVAIDQEGGTVDRLMALDGPRSAAATIGATNDPEKAKAAGIQDAKDLASYGFNLNLAPVVDVTNVYNPQLYDRTYGNNVALVTKMAQAYLQGLQQSGKVLGTLKHFPGLGDVGVDPHSGVPDLYRSKSDLEAIDWAPYRTLIQQGNVYAILVTHEIVHAIDSSVPSSLSYKVVTGILRDELGFQGVIVTDSLTMEGITAYYSEDQAAAMAVEAGSDLLMGPTTPADVASMIQGIKQAIDAGTISQQRIDDSVRRILMLKYQMGLLPLPKN